MKARSRNTIWLLIGGLMAWLFFGGSRKQSGQSQATPITSSGSAQKVLEAIKKALADYSPTMQTNWYLVAKMETANFTSDLFTQYNNFLGMKQPKSRKTTSLGATPSGWASYASVQDCAKDLVLYMKEFNYPYGFPDLESQIQFMKSKGYFEESFDKYLSLVKAWSAK